MDRQLVLFEDEGFADLLPLVFWRSVFELQVSRKMVLDRTAQRLGLPVAGVWTRDWLATVAGQRCGAPTNQPATQSTVLVNGRWLFDEPVDFPKGPCVGRIESDVAFIVCDKKLAEELSAEDLLDSVRCAAALRDVPRADAPGRFFRYPWDITGDLSDLLISDWRPADASIEIDLDKRIVLDNKDQFHIGEHTSLHPTVVMDTSDGPIYISHTVTIGACSVLEGPLYIGAGCRVHPHTWLHGGNVIGPVCRVAGEIVGSVLHSYSNKQHGGFLGSSYVGSWVNFGAGSTNSNLKNTYGKVRVPLRGRDVDTGQQFFGAVIGDHAKIGINAAIPTGAAIGLSASVAATRVAPKYVPSFGWVTDAGLRRGDPLRLLDAASAAMARRNVDMTDEEVELFLDLGNRVETYEAPARSLA